MLAISLLLLCKQAEGLAADPIHQRSSLRTYDSGSKLINDHFDIPLTDHVNIMRAESDYTYFMARIEPGEYEFKKFSHSTMTATTVVENIMIDGYIVLHEETREIRVLTLNALGVYYYEDEYKVIKARTLLPDTIRVQCAKTDEYGSKAVYEIALAGSFTSDTNANTLDYYVSKFSTKANFTLNVYESVTSTVSEEVLGVYIDIYNSNQVYVVLDVNVNVVISAMAPEFGTLLWSSTLGPSSTITYFSGLSFTTKSLHCLLTTYTTPTKTQMLYTRLSPSTGMVVASNTITSFNASKGLDIVTSQSGTFIMAIVGDNLEEHYDNTKYWQTINNTDNWVVMMVDDQGQILDVEGYDLSTMEDPHPVRFALISGTSTWEFMFYAHRSNDDVNGLFITKFDDSTKVFINDTAGTCTDTTNCQWCNPEDLSKCMLCQSGKFLFENA